MTGDDAMEIVMVLKTVAKRLEEIRDSLRRIEDAAIGKGS